MCIRESFIGTLLAKDYLIEYHSCISRQTRPQGGLDALRKKGWGSLGEGCPFLLSFGSKAKISRSSPNAPQKVFN